MTPLDSLYITYWSLRDPLTRSQALPVVEALARFGYRMGLMTFEQEPWAEDPAEQKASARGLAAKGIHWLPRTYHKRPPVVSTVVDVLRGAVVARAARPRLLHGRTSVGAAVAYLGSRWPRRRFFNDADGTLSLEYVDAGVWGRGSPGHRLTSFAEDHFLRVADASAVLTRVHAEDTRRAGHADPVVLPCCVDTRHFVPRPDEGASRRSSLGLAGRVLVYAGKLGGWYLVEQMFDFVAAYRRACGPVSLLVLTPDAHGPFSEMARAREVPCVVRTADRAEMPGYLSAADAGLSFILSAPSKRACSPVKNGEYLACGLPLVTTPGIGDYSDLIARERVGAVVTSFEPGALEESARQLQGLLAEPGLAERCRRVALEHLDLDRVLLPRYRDLYDRLLGPPVLGAGAVA